MREEKGQKSKTELCFGICRGDSFVVLNIKSSLSEKEGNERDRRKQSFKA